jgi:hypothetical protein
MVFSNDHVSSLCPQGSWRVRLMRSGPHGSNLNLCNLLSRSLRHDTSEHTAGLSSTSILHPVNTSTNQECTVWGRSHPVRLRITSGPHGPTQRPASSTSQKRRRIFMHGAYMVWILPIRWRFGGRLSCILVPERLLNGSTVCSRRRDRATLPWDRGTPEPEPEPGSFPRLLLVPDWALDLETVDCRTGGNLGRNTPCPLLRIGQGLGGVCC